MYTLIYKCLYAYDSCVLISAIFVNASKIAKMLLADN